MLLVLDTNVIVAAATSPTGASRWLLRQVGEEQLLAAASVPLFLEYESVLKRRETLQRAAGSREDMDIILDQLAAVLRPVNIWFLWRPQVRDANDDMVLEAAANASASHIVTFNIRDYGTIPQQFGISVCQPGELVRMLRHEQ